MAGGCFGFPTWTRQFFCSRVSFEEKLDLTKKGFQLWEEERRSPGLWIRVGVGLNGKRVLINDPSCGVGAAVRKDKSG